MTNLGIAFLPGTFPTGEVLEAIREAVPPRAQEWDRAKVNSFYEIYKEGILKDKQKPYNPPDEIGIKKYFAEKTNFESNDITVFLFVLYTLAKKGNINPEYWNITLQKTRSNLPGAPNLPNLNKFAKQIKTIGIIALIGAGLYFSWPLLVGIRKKIKR